MGNRKRNPTTAKPRPTPLPPTPSPLSVLDNGDKNQSPLDKVPRIDAALQVPSVSAPISVDAVKAECEKALTALRRGNHNKALRLMKEACAKYQDSSALLHRVHGTVFVKVATLMDDQNAKLRYLRCAVESARRAVLLSPDSVEFAHFYANLMYEVASDSQGYEDVMQECERALAIENPVDPAKESLQDESQQKFTTVEARVAHVQQELRSLIQKSNISSISTWMKNLGNGEEKFRLIPMRRLTEDPMEVRLVQSARRPNEIKKATKTHEERRKEIEVRVAAARLLQQKSSSPTQQQYQQEEQVAMESSSISSSGQRLVERRKLNTTRKVVSSTDRIDRVRIYWDSMAPDKQEGFLEVKVQDLRMHLANLKDNVAANLLSEALSFAETNGTWKFWVCCKCHEKFVDADSHLQHVEHEHLGNLKLKLQSVLPHMIDDDWFDKIVDGNWKPIDVFSVVKTLEDEQSRNQFVADVETGGRCKDVDSLSVYWDSRSISDSSASPKQVAKADDFCNGFTMEGIEYDHSKFDHPISNDVTCRWPLADDSERHKLLERIHSVLQLLAKNKCLSAGHLNKVIQFAIDEIQALPSGSQLMKLRLDESPICICFLGSSQLRKVLKFLQDLAQCRGVARCSENNNMGDDGRSFSHGSEYVENIVLNCDSTMLNLDSRFWTKHACGDAENSDLDNNLNGLDGGALVSWLFSGTSSGEQLASWTRLREEKLQQGIEVFQMLEKDYYHLQNMCEKKCERLSYEEALHSVESLCLEELKKREQDPILVTQSYDIILKKRQEELANRDNDLLLSGSRYELDAILNILKEAQSLNANQFGYDDTLSSVTSHICELDCGENDWRVQDFLHQADTCIEVAIQNQKEHTAVEICKIDSRIMRNLTGIEQLEHKLGPSLSFDYQGFVLPLVKSFMRARLEDLVDKDAKEKSDAAREAFLAELAMDAKKSINKGGGDHSKHAHEKTKDRRKNKDHRKIKDTKSSMVSGCNGEGHFHQESTEDFESLAAVDASYLNSDFIPKEKYLQQQEEEYRQKIELEAEERKLEETLEYQRRMEDEAKQRHLEEQKKRASEALLQDTSKGSSFSYSNVSTRGGRLDLLESGSSPSTKGIDFGDFHFPEITLSQITHTTHIDLAVSKLSNEKSEDSQVISNHRQETHETWDDVASFSQHAEMHKHSQDTVFSNLEQSRAPEVPVQRTKKPNGCPQPRNKQGSPGSSSHDGILTQEVRLDRCYNRWNGTNKLSDGCTGVLPQKVNNVAMHPKGSAKSTHMNMKGGKHKSLSEAAKKEIDSFTGENGAKSLKELHVEEDDEERFQNDLKRAVHESLGNTLAEQGSVGPGLQNEVGEYNCFLNVIIQSLWHLRRFRDEFLRLSSMHVHVGSPCVVCALYEIFTALSMASVDSQGQPVAPTCLRSALSTLYPNSNFFQEGQMNDASEVLAVIFDCLHCSFTSSSGSGESNCVSAWDCSNTTCIAHTLFGMNIYEQMNCQSCGLESRHLKYTSFFHNINANALRTAKVTCADGAFDELLKLVEMNHQVACDREAGGCGKTNYIHHILSSSPYVFTTVLGWQNTCESAEDISATLAAITTGLDIGILYQGLELGKKHVLISMVCYYGQHYHCFAYNHEREQWLLYDDRTVKVIGGWDEVRSMCVRGHLQPQVLFFEAVN